jgi:ankyrin repeat protein
MSSQATLDILKYAKLNKIDVIDRIVKGGHELTIDTALELLEHRDNSISINHNIWMHCVLNSACNAKMTSVVSEILKHSQPSLLWYACYCNAHALIKEIFEYFNCIKYSDRIAYISYYWYDRDLASVLMIACRNKLNDVVIKILQYDTSTIYHVNKAGETALIIACKNKLNDIAFELLKYLTKCKIDQVNTSGDTALILACKNAMTDVALELLKYPSLCKIDQVNTSGDTALILACINGMTDIALELLRYPSLCKIDQVNKSGDTALILACKNRLNSVALELLKHIASCKIDQISNTGDIALVLAKKNNMPEVVDILRRNMDSVTALNLIQWCSTSNKAGINKYD